MTTLVLQTTVALILVAIAAVALKIVRADACRSTQYAAGWQITGVVYLLYSAVFLVQSLAAVVAVRAGVESTFYAWYMLLAPVGNHARTALMFGFYILLAGLAVGWRAMIHRGAIWAVSIVTLVAGAVFGYLEGPLDIAIHLPLTAMIDTAGFILLGALLFLLMIYDRVDRYLWFFIALFGLKSVVGALYIATMAWFYMPGSWTPPLWQLHLVRAVMNLIVLGIVIRRLQLARNGKRIEGLLPVVRARVAIG